MTYVGVTEADRRAALLYLPRGAAANIAAERNTTIHPAPEPTSTAAVPPLPAEQPQPASPFAPRYPRHPSPSTEYIEGNRAERRRREQAQRRAMKRARAQQRERGR